MRAFAFSAILLAVGTMAAAQQTAFSKPGPQVGPAFVHWTPAVPIASDRGTHGRALGFDVSRGEQGALAGAAFLGTAFALARLAWCSEDRTRGSNCLAGVLGFALVGGTMGAVLGAFIAGRGQEQP